MLVRAARAQLLFGRVMASYALQWVLWRLTARRLFGARWSRVHQTNARRLAGGFAELRGLFIKAGQVLSVMGGFLPQAYGNALEKLQDAVPPRSFEEMEQRLIEAYGASYRSNFSEISESPVASASLAQVHAATTTDGQRVAVKMLYPGIEAILQTDIKVLRRVVPVVHWVFGMRQSHRVLDQLSAMVQHETDFEHEAQNLRQLGEVLANTPHLRVPKLIDPLCKCSVLVMSFEHGYKLSDAKALAAAGIDGKELAKTLVGIYLEMLFEHRLFHADPHPGNFLANEGNELCMLDFGAVETISEDLVAGMKQVILGGLSRDSDAVFRGVVTMGFVAENGDETLLRQVTHDYLQTLTEVNITNFSRLNSSQVMQLSGAKQLRGKLRSIASSLQYPDGYFYVERTLALLFGLVGQLAPDQGLLGLAAPQASKILMRGYARRASELPTASKVTSDPSAAPLSRSEDASAEHGDVQPAGHNQPTARPARAPRGSC